MSNVHDTGTTPVLDLRFGPVGLVHVRVRRLEPEAVLAELRARAATAPRFFDRASVAVDLGVHAEASAERVAELLAVIRDAGLVPVGLVDVAEPVDALARALGVPLLTSLRGGPRVARDGEPGHGGRAGERAPMDPASSADDSSIADAVESRRAAASGNAPAGGDQARAGPAAPAALAAPAARGVAASAIAERPADESPTLLHVDPVRSGQQVYARGRDLVVTAAVGAGAEAIADGCVHVYGPLRGRAIAGARGDVRARVFCQDFRAELVAIAGVFRVFETLPPELEGRPVQAWLDGEQLRLARLVA